MTTTEHRTDDALEQVSNGDAAAREVTATGRIQEISWRTRTALLYDDEGAVTKLSFTPEQDGWMRLVADIPVDLQGIAHVDDGGEDYVELQVVSVKELGWRPKTTRDYLDVSYSRLHHQPIPPPLPWYDEEEHRKFMSIIRDMREAQPL